VNIARLLQEAPQAQAASQALENEFAARRRDLENQQKDLKAARTAGEGRRGDGRGRAPQREKTLRDGQRELARKQNEFLEDLNVRRNEALGQLQRTVLQEVQTYAKGAGLDIVVADALYASQSVDITNQVLTALQSRKARRRPPSPEAADGREAAMPLRLAELAVRFGCELQGDADALVERVAPLHEATSGSLAFLANPRYRRYLAGTRATAVVLDAATAAECRSPRSSPATPTPRTPASRSCCTRSHP